ncbi:MAG TPA: GAF domain-containing sensor histidine kinase, partial [Demequina sp.]|nr:GAF domain-containing sensor histidine kinase [Demequina sp.]
LPIPVRDRRFWVIQALVLGIVVTHLALERDPFLAAESQFYLLSVSILLVPVVYAGMRFGVSGALPTTAWALMLSAPEILGHRTPTRVGILVQFAIIFMIAFVVGLRADRERAAAGATEQANARLSRINATASAVAQSLDLGRVLDETLRAKLDRSTRQVAWIELLPGPNTPRVTVVAASQVVVPSELDEIQRGLTEAVCLSGQVQREPGRDQAARSAAAPIISDGIVVGALGVTYPSEPIPPDEYRVLEAVGTQLGTALSNIRHHASAREGLVALSIANENLETYVELATEAQEEERKRLSRELHDDTMQSLVLTLAQIDTAMASELPDEAEARLADAKGILAETLDNIRRFCRDLRPSLIDDLGLVDAVDWLVSDLRSRVGMTVGLEVHEPRRRLSSRDELLVFRIVQEALHNVERHAQAAWVGVVLDFRDGRLVAQVVDDGRGFASSGRVEREKLDQGLGLRGMHERTKLLRGSLVVESRPGRGTTVRLSVPVAPAGRPVACSSLVD